MPPQNRILWVDDSENDTDIALYALSQTTLRQAVATVRDGAGALDYLYRRGEFSGRDGGHPAVVLLDLKMPFVNGVEVLRQIKSDPELRRIPVVIFSSSIEDRDLDETYRLGANAYVVKPISFHDFINIIKELGRFWTITNVPPPAASLN